MCSASMVLYITFKELKTVALLNKISNYIKIALA